MSLGLTKYGRLLKERMKNYFNFSILELATIDEVYDKLSLKLDHYQEMRTPATEDEWKETHNYETHITGAK